MNRVILLLTLLIFPVNASGNPNEPPNIREPIKMALGIGADQLTDLTIINDSLTVDGFSARYFTEFQAMTRVNIPTYAEVETNNSYVVVQPVHAFGDTVPVLGNALGVYEDGEWEVQINVLEMARRGGHPLDSFREQNRTVLIAGRPELEEFVAKRREALEFTHQLALQQLEMQAKQQQREAELEAKKVIAEREALAKQEDLESRLEARVEANFIKERAMIDSMLMGFFEAGTRYKTEFTVDDVRFSGVATVSNVSDALIGLVAEYKSDPSYTFSTPVTLNLGKMAGDMVTTVHRPYFGDGQWNFDSGNFRCPGKTTVNTEGNFILFPEIYCGGNRLSVFLSTVPLN